MNFKELVDTVSAETEIPASQVRKVGTAILAKFTELINSQGEFYSPEIVVRGVVLPAMKASEGKPARPERKAARMTLRTKKVDE
jgi:hypothetical protein